MATNDITLKHTEQLRAAKLNNESIQITYSLQDNERPAVHKGDSLLLGALLYGANAMIENSHKLGSLKIKIS